MGKEKKGERETKRGRWLEHMSSEHESISKPATAVLTTSVLNIKSNRLIY